MEMITHTDHETFTAGERFARTLSAGVVVCLYGDLGAGKTTFVKGVATGLGITTAITSPTFTLMNIYSVPHNTHITELVHVDTYRLKDPHELIAIGIEDYIGKPDCVLLVEWPDKVEELFTNKKVRRVTLEHTPEGTRRITIEE